MHKSFKYVNQWTNDNVYVGNKCVFCSDLSSTPQSRSDLDRWGHISGQEKKRERDQFDHYIYCIYAVLLLLSKFKIIKKICYLK